MSTGLADEEDKVGPHTKAGSSSQGLAEVGSTAGHGVGPVFVASEESSWLGKARGWQFYLHDTTVFVCGDFSHTGSAFPR